MVDRPAYRYGVGYTQRNYAPHFFYNPYYLPNQTKATVYFSTPTYGETPTSPSANLSGAIKIRRFELLKRENEPQHFTQYYNTDKTVLRRGFGFTVRIFLSKEYDVLRHALNVEFRRGLKPGFLNNSRFECIVDRRAVRNWEWNGSIKSQHEKSVDVEVNIPVDTPVGEYEVIAEAVDVKTNRQDSFKAEKNVVILFNPWHSDDDVYLEDEEERKEYVLNGSGRIWAGTSRSPFARKWEFEQFESYCLDSALYLLDRFDLDSELRSSPVHITRACTAMVNANDNDGGVLVGNWCGNYDGGTSPLAWAGSGAILEHYWRRKKPVLYAQCWVFGGVLTSVLRSLGIPTRPVTNFVSAHDTDANRAVDFYFDEKGVEVEHLSADSIWNYHVWTEAWMERPDLKGHYGGWQALDATPQEPSPHSGVFTLGPAPVAAIKEGADRKYDTEFVISEVNADINMHIQKPGGEFRLARSNTRKVGKVMMTKAVGSAEGVDVIANYKHTEGTAEERVTLDSGGTEQEALQDDVTVDIVVFDDVMIGKDLKAKLVLTSTAMVERTVDFIVRVQPVTYVGCPGNTMATIQERRTLVYGKPIEIPFSLPPSEYIGKVRDQLMVNISAFITVKETDSFFVDKETFRFKTPDIHIKPDKKSLRPGQRSKVKASFKNPLNVTLNNVEWFVEGIGLTTPLVIPGQPVLGGKEASVSFEIVASNAVEPVRHLVVGFESTELEGLDGEVSIAITQ